MIEHQNKTRAKAVAVLTAVVLLFSAANNFLSNKSSHDDAAFLKAEQQQQHRTLRNLSSLDPRTVILKDPSIEQQDNAVALMGQSNPGSEWSCSKFIDVRVYTEGFSGWRMVLVQVLQVIDAMPGASLVEPCMIDGRLKSCRTPYPPELEGSPIPVSQILDLDAFTQSKNGEPPVMTLYEEFVHRTQQLGDDKVVKEFGICPKASNGCPKPFVDNNWPNEKDRKENEIYVYYLYVCWWGRCALELDRHLMGDAPHIYTGTAYSPEFKAPPELRMHPRIIQMVKEVLSGANINDFSLIHWRGERKNLDYIKCAEKIVTARQNIIGNMPPNTAESQDHPFLVMTSIDDNPDRQWNGNDANVKGMASNGSPKEALAILKDNGFIKFDTLLKDANIPVQDPGMLGIYELIAATLSRYFSTCTRGDGYAKGAGLPIGCPSNEVMRLCSECNYLGKFAKLAVDMRRESPDFQEDTTYGCWPV